MSWGKLSLKTALQRWKTPHTHTHTQNDVTPMAITHSYLFKKLLANIVWLHEGVT